ncbi:uncharacterized protein LOC131685726 [Topomyia yanbarensis]|uniref:uncharacterized protein LOC131685726 n=1 Tax=Topomyia yanbarensis TaxID=2498891 RepID=UPI00273B1021|nr:uncharacterized protein LOC131685726 [Topomyia yanbarensis]
MLFKILLPLGAIATLAFGQSPEQCIASSCKTYKEINTLWCYPDPNYFCQCRPITNGGSWTEQVMPCADGTKFSFRQQVCVLPQYYNATECLDPNPNDPVTTGNLKCSNPCTTYAEIVKLGCSPSGPKEFCQCRPTPVERVFTPIKMPCANGTSFSYRRQTCMADGLWTDSCPM